MNTKIANPYALPENLPTPTDDGACAHLIGLPVPNIILTATNGTIQKLAQIGQGFAVVYIYPATGVPGRDPISGWDDIPGAPGCTLQSLGFNAQLETFKQLGYSVFGISSQLSSEQLEFKQRTQLSLELLSDPDFLLAEKLKLPRFSVQQKTFYKRMVMVFEGGFITQVFYPVFPPDQSADQVVAWLQQMS